MTEYTTDQLLDEGFTPEVEESEESTTEAATQEEQSTGEGETTEAAEKDAATEEVKPAEASTPEAEGKESEPEENWTKAAVLDERRKRQELQARLDQLEAQQRQEPAEKPDWYDDPEKAANHQATTFQAQLEQQKFELTQDMMRSVHPDYDEMETRFVDLARENPHLVAEMQKSANPARFAYETAKKAAELDQLKNVDEYKAKVEAEARAEIEAKVRKELEEKYQRQAAKDEALSVPSLAGTPSKGGLSSSDYAGPTPLDDILKGSPSH